VKKVRSLTRLRGTSGRGRRNLGQGGTTKCRDSTLAMVVMLVERACPSLSVLMFDGNASSGLIVRMNDSG
jgi:hypothetical protein